MDGIIEIGPFRLLAAYAFLVLLLFLVRKQGIGKEKEIIISTLRMTIQLIIMGYVLVYIFEQSYFYVTLLVFAVMLFFAIRNIFARIKTPVTKKLRRVIILSMITGTVVTTFYFLLLVLSSDPWYEARYFIPIAGMIIGNSMTGVALGVERLIGDIKAKKQLIEGALMLGATPKDATLEITRDVFTSAIMPTINSMVGMGIIFIPGMMTGQILAGASPLVAIEYQIAIMLGILGSVSITLFMLTRLGYLTFFNRWSQLEENSD
ncbi:MAG: iron export ABC transporter permease subunit FetB [Bacillota bacterium]|nr:iron export ABC transporter permease subunit FetB [Bacillota bacterium]